MNHNINFSRIKRLLDNKDYLVALNTSVKFLTIYPDAIGYKKAAAFCHSALGNLTDAKELWLELVNTDPFDEETLINLADIEQRMGRFDSALGLLKLASEYHPTSIKPYLNMGGLYLLKNEFTNALNVSLQAVTIDPKHADGFQNLGSSFFNLAMFDEAKHAFDTSLLLNPNSTDAKTSLAVILAKQNKVDEALSIFEELISNHIVSDRIPIAQLKWDSSLLFLRAGNLEKGFEYYEYGMSSEVRGHLIRRPSRTFKVPKWSPDASKTESVLVWREQGIGDEILFSTCIQNLIDDGFYPIIETDKRLIPIYERSFPTIKVREAKFLVEFPHDSFYEDFGTHIPLGSLLFFYRKSLNQFPNSSSYLLPEYALVSKWRSRLSKFGTKKLIGISWKGGLADPLRNSKYTKLAKWDTLLKADYVFINLQYGDCIDEIREVESALGITIHTWEDLDLKNDLEDIFALLKNIHHVVSVSTAIWMFAAAVGTPTSVLLHTPHWTMFDQDYTPFFPDVNCLVTNQSEDIPDLLPVVLSILNQ